MSVASSGQNNNILGCIANRRSFMCKNDSEFRWNQLSIILPARREEETQFYITALSQCYRQSEAVLSEVTEQTSVRCEEVSSQSELDNKSAACFH
jgi:hypothetical protein